jgi:hypothetical protein
MDRHVSSWALELPDTLQEEQQLTQRLQQSKLQPTNLHFYNSHGQQEGAGDALAAAGLNSFMQQVEKAGVLPICSFSG